MNRQQFGSIGMILLALFLIIFGATMILSIAIPGWAIGGLAVVAGILLLVGR